MTQSSTSTTDAEASRQFFERSALDLRTWTPATVLKVYPGGRLVDVRPDVSKLTTLDGVDTELPMALIPSVPVAQIGDTAAGLFLISDVAVGTEGWLLVSDRPLDNWQDGSGAAAPPPLPMFRHHDLTDAIFLPMASRTTHTRPEFNGKIALTNAAGTCFVTVDATGVRVQVPGGASLLIINDTVTIDAAESTAVGNLTVTGNLVVGGNVMVDGLATMNGGLTMTGGSGAVITGPVNITGNLTVSGNITGGSFTGDNT